MSHPYKLGLVDLEAILFKCLFAVNGQGYSSAIRACDNYTSDILERFDSYRLFLSGPNNFRKKLYPEYKANRKGRPLPDCLQETKEYFIKYWGAEFKEGFEADDLIAMNHDPEYSTIVAVDKDLKMLGGQYFNLNTGAVTLIEEPMLHFWIQMLVGDATDNVPGVKNPEKAHHKNPPNFTEQTARELLEPQPEWIRNVVVRDMYERQFGDRWEEQFNLIGNLIWLKHSEDDNFKNWI